MALRPIEQLRTAREAHRHAQRKLVRRRDVDELGLRWQRVHHQALGVHRHGHHVGAQRLQRNARGWIARVFNGHRVARSHQHAGNQIDGLLRALRDNDIAPRTDHGAAESEVARDRQAQRLVTGRVVICAAPACLQTQPMRHAAAPLVEREQALLGHATHEVVDDARARHGQHVGHVVPQRGESTCGRCRCGNLLG